VDKKRAAIISVSIICIIGILYIFRPVKKISLVVGTVSMKLSSPAFENFQKIPVSYTCDGNKIHPPLTIAGMPAETKSLIIIVDDPDAPNGTFTHWIIWNIDPSIKEIQEGIVPEKSQEGMNSAGTVGYTPPCPPSTDGKHRYFFTLYALDAKLGLDGKATKKDVEQAMVGHVMEQSLLMGVY